jgi:membrane-bound lytic murein transglycosylase D
LWQFIEATGRRFGLRVDYWVDERRDPVKATVAAAMYLKELYAEFGDWRLAWAGYNAGAGKVRKAIQNDGSTRFWDMVEGRTLRRETKEYVPKLMAAALISKHLSTFGFSESEIEDRGALEYDEVEVPEATDLDVIARAAGVKPEEIRELNPQLKRWCTPPSRNGEPGYKIRLPAGTSERFAEEYAKIAPKDRLTFRTHTVARGDTIGRIATRYGTPADEILKANRIRDRRKLRVGETLVIPVPASEEGSPTRQARVSPTPSHTTDRPEPKVAQAAASARASERPAERAGSATSHTVKPGDSLWSIAREHDVHVEEILRWNGLSKKAKLKVGQQLRIEKSAPQASTKGSKHHHAKSARR